jgi:hypothetical protein
VQVKNNAAAGVMNMRCECDGELGPVMNPHNVSGPHALEQRAKDGLYYPAMKEPGQAAEFVSPALIKP